MAATKISPQAMDALRAQIIARMAREGLKVPPKPINEALLPQPGPQELFVNSTCDIVGTGGGAGGGKCGRIPPRDAPWYTEDMETKVLTPKGFKLLGDIEVGDQVTNPDGTTATVIATHFPKDQQFYRVTFSDGASVEAGADHLWGVRNATNRKRDKVPIGPVPQGMSEVDEWNFRYFQRYAVVTTTELFEQFSRGDALAVPLTSPCTFTRPSGRWPILPPYTIGVLIGDGSMSGSSVSWTKPDEFVVEKVAKDIAHLGLMVTEQSEADRHGIARPVASEVESAQELLRRVGLMGTHSYDRFIPDYYKMGSIETRYAIINGLMDTDGSVDDRGHVEYSTASKQLAEDVQWVLRSLGYTATISVKAEPKIGDIIHRPSYRIYVRGNNMKRLFTLPRKLSRMKDRVGVGSGSTGDLWVDNRIVSIEPTVVEDGKCITVDNPNHLYVTDDFIVTHNTYSILLDALRYVNNPKFGAVVFRREGVQIRSEGGLWDTSTQIFPHVGAVPREHNLDWKFPSGASVTFNALQHETDILNWQGSQICGIYFDEATHFSRKQFIYMMSRNRSDCGIKPYIRLTFNPDPDSWVFDLFGPWVNPEHPKFGAKGGDILWMKNVKGEFTWVPEGTPNAKSITFIPSLVHDNKKLLEANPEYLDNLQNLADTDRERLLEGRWTSLRTEGALWSEDDLGWEGFRLPPAFVKTADGPKFVPPADIAYIAIGVDPTFADPDAAKNPEKELDKCGVIVAGVDNDGIGYVFYDGTIQSKAEDYVNFVAKLYKLFDADIISVESYGGGQVVTQLFDIMYGPTLNVKATPFKRGDKASRARPVAMLYKRGKVHHCGKFPALEHQMKNWDPRNKNARSPNNIDALVWAFDALGLCNSIDVQPTSRMKYNLVHNEDDDEAETDKYLDALNRYGEAIREGAPPRGYLPGGLVSMLSA